MSRVKIRAVRDSRLPIVGGDHTTLLVPEGPAAVQYQSFSPADPASLNPNFTVDVPSPATGLSRQLWWRMTGSFTVTGVNLANCLAVNCVALRQFPLQQMTTSMTIGLGTSSVSIGNLSQIVAGLLRVGNPISSTAGVQSSCPAAPDWYSSYSDAVGTLSSPFAPSGDIPVSTDVAPGRTVGITNITVNGPGTSMTVNFTVSELIIVPPFGYTNSSREKAVYGLKQVVINANMSVVSRGLSIAIPAGTTISAVSLTPTSQSILATFVTPDAKMADPRGLYRYDYTTIQPFTSTLNAGVIAAGAQFSGSSTVCTSSVIPEKILVFATYSETDRSDATQSLPDAFLPIIAATAQVNSRSGIFSGATDQDLWNVTWKNGCKTPFFQYRGLSQVSSGVLAANWPKGSGSPLLIDVAADCGLEPGKAPGMTESFTFNLTSVTVENNLKVNLTGVRLQVIFLTGGYIEIKEGMVTIVNGGVMASDISKVPEASMISSEEYHALTEEAGFGGSKIGDFFKKALPVLADIGTAVGSVVAPELALPLAASRAALKATTGKGLSGGAPSAGARSGGARSGGALVGGARMSRAMLFE